MEARGNFDRPGSGSVITVIGYPSVRAELPAALVYLTAVEAFRFGAEGPKELTPKQKIKPPTRVGGLICIQNARERLPDRRRGNYTAAANQRINAGSLGHVQGFDRFDKQIVVVAFDVTLKEQLRADDALGVDQIRPGIRNPLVSRSGLAAGVEDAVSVDRLASRVREQSKRDALGLGISFQSIDRIVADADDLRARGLDGLKIFLQLNQLPLAEGSPIGRAEKNQRDIAFGEQRGE